MGHLSGFQSSLPSGRDASHASFEYALRTRVDELERRLDRLELENRVLCDLLKGAFKLTEEQFESRVKEIDARDGVRDGKITPVPLRCPACKRVASSRHWRCLYCGQEFEKHVY